MFGGKDMFLIVSSHFFNGIRALDTSIRSQQRFTLGRSIKYPNTATRICLTDFLLAVSYITYMQYIQIGKILFEIFEKNVRGGLTFLVECIS